MIGHGFADELEVSGLLQDDVANLYQGNGSTLIASATYDATPTINETACIGRNAFNVKKSAGAPVIDAGAYEPFADGVRALRSVWTAGDSFTVSLERPLQAGRHRLRRDERCCCGDTEVRSYRGVARARLPVPARAGDDRPRSRRRPRRPRRHRRRRRPARWPRRSRGRSARAGSSLRPLRLPRLAKRQSLVLPFAFPEPGTVKLDLVAKGQTVGTGTKSSTANGKFDVSIKLTPAGRKLFKRTKKTLKVTLKGTFTPARTGQGALNAGVTVTLKR